LLGESREPGATKRKAPPRKGQSRPGKSNFTIDNEDTNFTERLGIAADETDQMIEM